MSPLVYVYLVYLIISISLTVWVASTLFKHGRIFLIDSFHGQQQLADSINHLLIVGFYLINIGYVCLALQDKRHPEGLQGVLEVVSQKIGIVLLILGAMHFFNMLIFSKMRKRALLHKAPPPVPPQSHTTIVNS